MCYINRGSLSFSLSLGFFPQACLPSKLYHATLFHLLLCLSFHKIQSPAPSGPSLHLSSQSLPIPISLVSNLPKQCLAISNPAAPLAVDEATIAVVAVDAVVSLKQAITTIKSVLHQTMPEAMRRKQHDQSELKQRQRRVMRRTVQ